MSDKKKEVLATPQTKFGLNTTQKLQLENASLKMELAYKTLEAAKAFRNSLVVDVFNELGIPEDDFSRCNVDVNAGVVTLRDAKP